MKKSRIILITGAGFIFLSSLLLINYIRIESGRLINSKNQSIPNVESSGFVETKNYNFKDFDSLSFENLWNVKVREGRNYSISVKADKTLMEKLKIEKNGSSLDFTYNGYIRGITSSNENVVVVITMPKLEKMIFSGMGNILIEDFDQENLRLVNSGASSIECRNVTIEYLTLIVEGASNADLSGMKTENCNLDVSGAAKIKLSMNGGNLTGTISGAASVEYSGAVRDENVSLSGIGSLDKI